MPDQSVMLPAGPTSSAKGAVNEPSDSGMVGHLQYLEDERVRPAASEVGDFRGVATVPITRSPRSSSWVASSRPNPLPTPVMSQVRAVMGLSFRCGRWARPRRGRAGALRVRG